MTAPEPTPYTPTTLDMGDVRLVYASIHNPNGVAAFRAAEARFDAALAAHDARVRAEAEDGMAAVLRMANQTAERRGRERDEARAALGEARRDALNEAADVMSADTTLYADLEALCEKSANPSTLADQVQDAAVAWLRAAETPDGGA
jgi:hypothetical protein